MPRSATVHTTFQDQGSDALKFDEFFSSPKAFLGPMAGVSDVVFRQLALEQGAALTYTEMVSAQGLAQANERTRCLLKRAPNEKHVVVQLFGHDADVMARAAAWIEDTLGYALAYLDINMGCPARKIVRRGDGAALMNTPERACALVKAVVRTLNHPVTVKFRRGWTTGKETAPEFAQRLEQAGAAACTVHGRYADQLYHGRACWDVIARVKEAVSVPVIGNGDIENGYDAIDMVKKTGCDAVMVARKARGNPWIFAQCRAALLGQAQPKLPSFFDRIDMARRHAYLLAAYDSHALVRMRKCAMYYVAGMPGAAAAREQFSRCQTLEDFNHVFDALLLALSDKQERSHI